VNDWDVLLPRLQGHWSAVERPRSRCPFPVGASVVATVRRTVTAPVEPIEAHNELEAMISPEGITELLGMQPHPEEGGYFVETYKSEELIPEVGRAGTGCLSSWQSQRLR
jgi:hypothetical protein